MTKPINNTVAIIGGGPAGLMAADVLCANGIKVDLYDAMPSLGRKFLMAGKSGLNLTHSEQFDDFLLRYGTAREYLGQILLSFPPSAIQAWAHGLGIKTFVGTSGMVFPHDFKAAPLLRAWIKKLRADGMRVHVRHKWTGWNIDGEITFTTPNGDISIKPSTTILALGGASWPTLGSDGSWVNLLKGLGVEISPLKPSNCGFNVNWSNHLRERFNGHPLKGVMAHIGGKSARGEFIITETGIEGGPVYALSSIILDAIEQQGSATLHIDLTPDIDQIDLVTRLSKPLGKKSMATHLKRTVGIGDVKSGLLHEFTDKSVFTDPIKLAANIKDIKINIISPRPISEAISTAGGVGWNSLTSDLELKSLNGVYVAGEMIDWDAPTGGYLLTACMATGRWVGKAIAKNMVAGKKT